MANKLDAAKIQMIFKKNCVFFATMMYQINWEYSHKVPTAAVNRITCKVNPEWFNNLDAEARVGLLAHEIMHIALMHQTRIGMRDRKLWNIAADYLINFMLKKQGFVLPEGGLYHEELNDTFTTEEIYNILVEDDKKDNPKYIPEDYQSDLGEDSEGSEETSAESTMTPEQIAQQETTMTPEQIAQQEAEITELLVNAATQTEMKGSPGSIPDNVTLLIKDTLYPKISWTTILFQYMTEFNKDDYSWQRRNRRYQDTYMPALYSEGMGKISTYLDISCSVTDKQFAEQHKEMLHIKKVMNPSEMEIIEFDTSIKEVRTFSADDTIQDLVFTGRGGTCLSEVGQRIAKTNSEVSVIFTDGHVDLTPIERLRDKHIIWCIIDNPSFTSTIGKVIHLN